MSLFAGKYTYKNYDIMFWLTPKTIKATIWKPNSLVFSLVLMKCFFVRNTTENGYSKLKSRIIKYIDESVEQSGDEYI